MSTAYCMSPLMSSALRKDTPFEPPPQITARCPVAAMRSSSHFHARTLPECFLEKSATSFLNQFSQLSSLSSESGEGAGRASRQRNCPSKDSSSADTAYPADLKSLSIEWELK